jgi:hypothetical protein
VGATEADGIVVVAGSVVVVDVVGDVDAGAVASGTARSVDRD